MLLNSGHFKAPIAYGLKMHRLASSDGLLSRSTLLAAATPSLAAAAAAAMSQLSDGIGIVPTPKEEDSCLERQGEWPCPTN